MATFTYEALEGRGTVVAESPQAARRQLRERGLTVARVKAKRETPSLIGVLRRDRLDLADFARQLATLVGVGSPVTEAIEAVARQHTGRTRAALDDLVARVHGGRSLAEAMTDGPAASLFDPLTVQLVDVGQRTGTLAEVLERVADLHEQTGELRGRVITALIYPLVILGLMVPLTVFLMTFVVPQVLRPLTDSGRTLPLATRIVKGASDLLLQWGWLMLIVAAAAGIAAVLWSRSETGAERWHRWQLRVPLLGPLIRRQTITHLSTVLAALLRSGIDFTQAAGIAARSCPQRAYRAAMLAVRDDVANGVDMAAALESTGRFPPPVVQAFAVGQRSGKLDAALQRVAAANDAQTRRDAARLTAVIEPVLILVVATLVGLIVFATMLPIMKVSDAFT